MREARSLPFHASEPVDAGAPDGALATDAHTLERYASDWGLVQREQPRGVARPTRGEEVAALLAFASARERKVTVRGQGYSAEGQSLGDDIVLSTERLDRIVSVTSDRVTVEAGARWESVFEALAPRGLYPPVVTGWLPASVGGTLSSGGFSKGSHRRGFSIDHVASLVVVTGDGRRVACSSTQAGGLFDAVLGGFGHFGVIVEATLRVERQPPFVEVRKAAVGNDARALHDALDAATGGAETCHVTAFATPDGSWVVVQALARADAALSATRAPPALESRVQTFASYLAPARVTKAPGPASWLHVFVPGGALVPLLTAMMPRLRIGGGDAIQVIPVRKLRSRSASLFQSVDVPDGEVVYAVCVTREVRDRALAALEEENRGLRDEALRMGGKSYLLGTLPRGPAAWRTYLGASYEAVARAKKMADPADVLGSSRMGWGP